MKFYRTLSTLLIAAVLLVPAAACAPKSAASGAPTITPTATFMPTLPDLPTDIPEPTETEGPTETPAVTEAALDTTQAAPEATMPPGQATAASANQSSANLPPVDDKYQYISQTLPDGYQVRPNVTITQSWSVKNTGATLWNKNYMVRVYTAQGIKLKTDSFPFPREVAANTPVDITVTFTTPANPGEYHLWYKLTNDQGRNFGDVDFTFTVTSSPNNSGKPVATPTP